MYNVPLNETSVRDIRSLCRFGPSFSPSALTLSVLGTSLFGALAMAFRGGDSFCLGGNVNLAWTTFPSICACMKKIRNIDFPTWFVFIIAHNSTPTLHSILWFYKPTPPPHQKEKNLHHPWIVVLFQHPLLSWTPHIHILLEYWPANMKQVSNPYTWPDDPKTMIWHL